MTEATQATDTQWLRWEVFKQDTPKKPHQAVGTVHATDPEHALLTARNVFARRPRAVSMWVVRADDIFSVTAEELEENPKLLESSQNDPQTYLICRKTSHRQSLTFVDHIGELDAPSPQAALKEALETFTDEEALVWWVFPENAVVRSRDEDAESWFEPAKDKTYKQQGEYGMTSAKKRKKARERAS